MNKKLHLLLASLAFVTVARADGGPDYVVDPVAVDGNGLEEQSLGEPMSCEEAARTAWFIRERARSEGETNPYSPCDSENEGKTGLATEAD